MISYALIDEEPQRPPPLLKVPDEMPQQIQQESECTIILFMFIGAVIALSLLESRK